MKDALAGIRVLDLSDSIAGNTCGKLLWRHGAAVTLIEQPGGSPMRTRGPRSPRLGDSPSPLFRHLNAGKKSVTVDVNNKDDIARVRRWANEGDVVIFDRQQRTWLDPESLDPSVIACQVDHFAEGTSRESWHASELIHQALSGAMYVTGSPDREPLYGVGHRAEYIAGLTAYTTVVAALIEREASKLGQEVTATVAESAAATGQNIITYFGYNGHYQNRREYPGMLSIMKCSDSWVIMFALRQWKGLCEVFGVPELIDDPRFRSPVDRAANWQQANEILTKAASTMVADDLVDRAQARKVSIEKVHTMADLRSAEQLINRGMIGEAGGFAYLGPVFRTPGSSDYRWAASAPLPSESWSGWGAA